MANVDIKLSQSTVDKLNQLPDGGGNNLSTIFGQIVETNTSISETFDWSNSWRISGNNVILKFNDINNRTIANLTYTGEIIPDYYGSSSGTAIASARVLNAPEYFKESVYGTLEYRYYAPSYLTYTSTFTNVERYELQSYVSDPDYGFSTFSLTGDIDINSSSGAVSGSISSLTAKATKIGTSVISGNFAVSSNTAAPESSSVTGTMTQYRTTYLDGSYTNISANFLVEANTELDETSFADAANWSGDDVVNVSLPATLYSDYIINSGDGADVITAKGGGGRLIINTGDGNDEIILNDLAPVIDGGDGIDTLKVSFTSVSLENYDNLENLVLLGTGNINGTGNALNNTITGNKGANRLFGGLGNDIIYAGDGNDYMEHVDEDGDPGEDSFYGGKGNDTYVIDALGATIYESLNEGTDIVLTQLSSYTLGDNIENLYYDTDEYAVDFTGTGNGLNNWIRSTAGNDTLYGLAGVDKIEGGAGNDLLDGGLGADTLIGGIGDDIYVVDNIKDVITEAVSAGTDEVRSSIAWTLGNNLENLTLTGASNINGTGNLLNNTITGNEGSNTLNGGAGNDTLYGEAGNDTLIGGLGSDTLYGGEGNDVYLMDATTDTIVEYSNEGVDEVRSGITFSIANIDNLENLVLLGTGNINGTGNALNNTITGNKGANRLFGGLGNDIIYAGDGNDYMEHVDEDGDPGEDSFYGGKGNDTYVIDALGATIYESLNEGTDIVLTQLSSYTLGDNIENLYYDTDEYAVDFTGTGNGLNNWIRSTAGNDTLYGLAGVDKIEGGAGNDLLDGGLGADTLIGGIGDDIYVVDNIKDVITEAVSAGTDEVRSSIAWTLGNNLENLTLTGASNINGTGNLLNNTITGNEGSNTLNGGAGNDTLYGEAGNDTLIGGLGNDMLTGGEGNDTFFFNFAISVSTENIDTITDFTSGDKIQFSQSIFKGLTKGAVTDLQFYTAPDASTAQDLTDRIIYNQSTGALYYDADGSATKAAPIQIAIIGSTEHPVLEASDLWVV